MLLADLRGEDGRGHGCHGKEGKQVPLITRSFACTCRGTTCHSSQFLDAAAAAGKRVVVIGGAKSAVDVAVAAEAAGAKSVTLLQVGAMATHGRPASLSARLTESDSK